MIRRRIIAAALALVALLTSGCAALFPEPQTGTGGALGVNAAGYTACGAGPVSTSLDAEQMTVARTIAEVALEEGLGRQGVLVGETVALTEATLRNLNHGDVMYGKATTSLGAFQQLAAWGPAADRTDVRKAARMFFFGGQAGQPGLTDIPGWESMPVPAAAQAVQQSQFADGSNFARNLALATQVTDDVMGACSTTAGSGIGGKIVAAARTQVGMPYVWGGGGPQGPSGVDEIDGRGPGFDCSGLTQWAVYVATGGQVTLQRTADAQSKTAGVQVPADLAQMQPGDLITFDNGPRVNGADHIGIYAGNGQMIHAPQSRKDVSYVSVTEGFYSDRSQWIVRRILPTT